MEKADDLSKVPMKKLRQQLASLHKQAGSLQAEIGKREALRYKKLIGVWVQAHCEEGLRLLKLTEAGGVDSKGSPIFKGLDVTLHVDESAVGIIVKRCQFDNAEDQVWQDISPKKAEALIKGALGRLQEQLEGSK